LHKTGSNSTAEIIYGTDFPITNCPVIDNCNFSSQFTTEQMNHLSLLLLNVQSITSEKASFAKLLNEHNPDLIAITETWLNQDISSSEFLPAHYTVCRRDRSDSYGGVLLAYRSTLNCQLLATDSNS